MFVVKAVVECLFHERVFAFVACWGLASGSGDRNGGLDGRSTMSEATLAGKRRRILEFIAEQIRERGYPPSVREIGEAVGLDLTLHCAHTSAGSPARGLLAARPDQAEGDHRPLGTLLWSGHSGPPCGSRPAHRSCRSRYRSARGGIGRRASPHSAGFHRRRRPFHVESTRRLDDRGRHSWTGTS